MGGEIKSDAKETDVEENEFDRMFITPLKYGINIISSANGGFLVEVGCCRMAYGKHEVGTLLKNLETFLQSPNQVEAAYNKSKNGPEGGTTMQEILGRPIIFDDPAED